MRPTRLDIFQHLCTWLFAVILMLNIGIAESLAQSSSQVTIVGVPPVLSSPFADDIESNFRGGQYQVIFNYSSFSSQPVDFVFDFILTRNNRRLVEITSAPMAFSPGSHVFSSFFEEIQFRETAKEILNRLPRDLQNQLVQSGAIPEGNYSIEITARPFTGQSGISAIPGRALFSVRYPTPPILVSIPDGGNVSVDTPTFSWTPVVSSIGGMFEYEFLLVEVFEGQSPLQAINSNREVLFTTLTGQTVLPYTLEYLPLEEGATYAWQVTAKDVNGRIPMQNGGETEIYTFTFKDREEPQLISDLSEIEEIILIPQFAELNNLDRLEISETASYYELNGAAQLTLDFDFTEPVATNVRVRGLRIQKASLDNPIIMGGELIGNVNRLENLFGLSAAYVQPDELRWSYGNGVSLSANITTPDGDTYNGRGSLQLQRSGVTGEVIAEAGAGEYLATIGSFPLEMKLKRIQAAYPGEYVTGSGTVEGLEDVICELPSVSMTGDSFSTFLDCTVDQQVPLVLGSELVTLELYSLTGNVEGTWNDLESLQYNLNLSSDIVLDLDENITELDRCGATGILNMNDENGLSAQNFVTDCSIPDPYLDLGVFKLSYSDLELTTLRNTADGTWDFEIELDANLFLQSAPGVKLPAVQSVIISPSGIQFPEISFDESQLQPFTRIELDLFEFSILRFEIDNQTFPWFDWDGTGPGPLEISFDSDVIFPDTGAFPGCLRNTSMSFLNAEIDTRGISGDLQSNMDAACRWEFGAGYAVNISELDGSLNLLYQNREIMPEANLVIDGEIELGEPFACGTGNQSLPVENFDFSFANGGYTATIEDLIPDCPAQVGPYEAMVTNSELSLNYSSAGVFGAELYAEADLNLGTDQNAAGTFKANLLTGEISEMNFELEGPFDWGIPKENPVLVFTIDAASLTDEGLFIDGRQTLNVDEGTMGVTFDELLIDWNTFEVTDGRIIFDESFSFEAGIDLNTNQLDYSATLVESSLALSPGLLMNLAGTVIIDTDGLHTSGQSNGELSYSDISLEEIDVIFSDDYAMSLDPFQVKSGTAEVFFEEQRIAWVDESGFWPDIGFMGEEFLPEHIPLPTEEVAYLEIKRDGALLVDAVNLGNGTYRLETLPGQPLKMVVPGLQGMNPAPPEVDVTLTDFLINPSSGTYISGTARAQVAGSGSPFDLETLGIPLSLNELIFTTQQIEQGDLPALFLNGNLMLLGHEFGEAGSVTLFIQNNGRVKGNMALSGLSDKIALRSGSERIVYELEALTGYVDIPLTIPGTPDFQFDIGGRFLIQDFDDQPLASASLESRITQQGFSVTNFDASDFVKSSTFDLGFFTFSINGISSLGLSYDPDAGFDVSANLDMEIEMLTDSGGPLVIPLKNTELLGNEGILIPAQDIHDGSMPLLDTPAFDLGIFRLQPLAFRTESFTLDIFDLSAGDLISLVPELDFEVTFPSFTETAPELNQIALSIYDATFNSGILAGTVYPYDIFGDPIIIPIGPAGIAVDLFKGRLYATDEVEQGMEIDLEGLFQMPENFGNEDQPCTDTRVAFGLSSIGGFSGRAEQFLPCGELAMGSLSLAFGQSVLDLNFENDEQTAILSGTATAEIEREGLSPVQASGDLSYDLISGNILNGSIGISEPFTWTIPADDPLFEFTVQTAVLDASGFRFNGNGELATGDGSVGVQFNDLAFSLADGELASGNVQIQNEFAVDIEFGPTRWSVDDPDNPVDYDSGIRLRFPSNITIDSNGFSATGQSTASFRFIEEVYDDLQVDFVDMAVGLSPVSVVSGRADLILDDGVEPSRLAYYDSGGLHLDNLSGAITAVLPNTLGLPTKEIAYIVLKNDQREPLVQTADTESGLQLSTTNPLPLVLAGLGDSDDTAPRVDVSFSDLIINDSFEVVSGSITADVSASPVNMDDLPIGLTAVHYKKEAGQPYKLYADARLNLPESISDLQLLVEDLILGSDGFDEALFSFGSYSEHHTEGSAEPVASHSFNDGDFIIDVRGVELNFGSEEFKLSGDVSSTFLSGPDEEPALLHFSSEHSSGNWTFALDDNLTSQEVPIGDATLTLDAFSIDSQSGFDLSIDGRFKMPNVLGSNFEIGFDGLKVGTSGVSLASGSADGNHEIGLFGKDDNLTLNNPSLSIQNNHLQIVTNGDLNILGQTFDFTGLQIGTDGTFELGSGGGALVTSPVNLMDEFLVLNSLDLGLNDSKAQLTAGLTASMPEPLESNTSSFDLTVDHAGNVESDGPSFTIGGDGVDLGGFADFKLTGAGLNIENIHDLDMTLFASADLVIDGKTGNPIQFGTPTGAADYGIRYRTSESSLEWNITNSPSFEFDTDILKMTIANLSLTDENAETFGVSMNTTAMPKLPGVDGEGLTLHGFTITTSGIGSMGDVQGGNFNLAGVITFELGKFEWGKNETISVTNQSGYQETPDIESIPDEENETNEIDVDEYLKFSPGINNGKAIKISIPGGFSGEINELFYYQSSDSFYLKIEGVEIKFGDIAELTASLEYLSVNGGDDFRLLVAGGGTLKSPLEGPQVGFSALGAISNIGGQFRFGIFVKLSAEIPILPGILSLTEVGAGFFYNPEESDYDHIISTAGHSFENDTGGIRDKPWTRTSADFAVALYAEATLITSVNAAEGSAILFLTNSFLYVDMDATLLGMGDEFKAGFTLSVQWKDHFLVKGSAFAKMGIDPLLTANMDMSFVLGYTDPDSDFIWGFTASADFKILSFLNANGEIMVSNTGFYIGVEVSGGFDVWVISVSAKFEAQVWWIYGEQFGAYVEIDVNATLFKVASVGANLKGALIIDDGFLIYAEASAYVKVLFVFNGNVSIWAAIRNGKISGGKGSNSEYTSMIDDARRNAQSIKNEMEKLAAQLDEISGAIEILKMTDEELDNAGQTLIGLDRYSQISYFSTDLNRFNIVPQVHEQIRDHIIGSSPADWQPVEPGTELNALLDDMNQKIDDLKTINETVKGRFEEAYELALEWDSEAMDLLEDLVQDPRLNISFGSLDTSEESESTGAMPEFAIDEEIDEQNREDIASYREKVGEMQGKFNAVIDSVQTYINRVDQTLSSTFTITPASGYTHPFTGEFILTGTPVLEKDQPSAKEVADQYVQTTTAIDKYYGNLVSHFWEVSRWGKIKFNNFDNLAGSRDEVIDANERILNDIWSRQGLFFEFIPGPEGADEEDVIIRDLQNNIVNFEYDEDELDIDGNDDDYMLFDDMFTTRADMIGRQERMYVLSNDNDWQDSSWRQQTNQFKNKLDEFMNDEKFTSFFGTFIQKGIEYWYEIPKRGLTQISQSTAFTADSLASDYKSKVRNVVNAHHNFTNTLDDIYRVKSSLTLTLHGIVDLYISELETLTDSVQTDPDGNMIRLDIDDAAEDMRQLKQEIENTLQPPKIMDLRVHKHLDEYNNKVNLFWSASHPSGTITEYSYMIMDESLLNNEVATIQLGQMLSTGNQNSVTRYLFKENEDQLNKTMQVLVRARGPSGTAISRPGNFTASVDIDDGDGSFFESQGSPANMYEVDGSPPLRPNVEFDYEQGTQQKLVARQQQTRQDQIQISDFTQNPGGIPQVSYEIVEQNVYWTNIADRIEFNVYSIDPESDISGYEYALGTSVSSTDIRDWTRIQGLNLERGFGGESNLNDWQRIRIQNVDLSDQDHYLSIRAINGEGLESTKRFVDKPIVYSGEPPSTPDFNEIEMPVIQAGRLEVNDPIFESPTVIYSHLSNFIPPKLEISWQPAVSLRAGIYGYEYVISENASADESFGQADEILFSENTEVNLTNSHGISYRDNFYIHLRAVDNAGNRSENAATLGPLVVPDPTRPDTPIIRASAKSGTIGFYVQGAGRDRESERDKYEFTFSRSGGLNKIPWAEISIRWLMGDFILNKASYTVAPITSANVGDPLILKVRAVNKQGIHSGISRSGPIIYDTSPPKTPTINLSKSGGTMTINISNIHDPESGVKRVEYLVCNVTDYGSVEGGCGHHLVNPYRELVSYSASRSGSFSLTKQLPISGSLSSKKVFVRVTNRNKMQTTASYQPVEVINIFGSEQQDEGDFELNNWWLEYDF